MGMVGHGNCWDSYANGTAGDDNYDNLFSIFDFSIESLEGNDFAGDWDITQSQCLGPIPSNMSIEPLINTTQISGASEPKQVSEYIQESFGSDIIQDSDRIEVPESIFFQTQSPNSAIESSGSCSTQKNSTKARRARSKRVRVAVNPWLAISPVTSKKERKKTGLGWGSGSGSYDMEKVELIVSDRVESKKCTHCEVTKTPQWREGPRGPKTLCNACGVRYRSGRLFPEYRPAASPTFVASVHSNSHKKVIEMRNKGKRGVPCEINK